MSPSIKLSRNCIHLYFNIQPTLNSLDSRHLVSYKPSLSLANDSSSISASPPFTPSFAATSREFNLFPKHERNFRRSHAQSDPPLSSDIDLESEAELTRLRSDAFWELRRSVAESGEGLVRRMRDYESSRSRGGVYSKAKDSIRRGRKRHSVNLRPRRAIGPEDGSDEEDSVQIYAGGESSEVDDYGSIRKKRAFSLGMADSGAHTSSFTDLDGSERCSSPSATFFSAPSEYNSDDESMDLINDSPLSMSAITSSPSPDAPALIRSFTNSTNSSFVSLPPPYGIHSKSSPPQQFSLRPTSPSLSHSEKAIAALSLAIANGAGGLNDYSALRAMEIPPIIEDSQVGELWH